MSNEYNADSIQTLGFIEGAKLRPSTFLENIGTLGILKMVLEGVQNSIDEASNSHASKIDIIINTKEPIIEIVDDGRGIPFGINKDGKEVLDEILTQVFSGGKYNNSNYSISSGKNGLGLALLSIFSDFLELEIYRDKKICNARYEKGYKKYIKIKDDPNQNKTGSKIKFKPTHNIFFPGETNVEYIDKTKLIDILEALAYVQDKAKFVMSLNIDGSKKTFVSIDSLTEYLYLLSKRNKINILSDKPLEFEKIDVRTNMKLRVVLTFGKNINNERYFSYVNNFPTIEHGKHVDGVRAAISKAFTLFIKNNDYIPKGAKYPVTGSYVTENVIGIVMAELQNPLFNNQTKNKLTSEDFFTFANNVTFPLVQNWIERNRADVDKICKLAVLKAKADYAAKEARESAMDAGSTKNILQSKVDLKKFTDCSGNSPENNELFLVEGDSAGGTVTMARDSKTQAYYRSRGKILNVVGKKEGQLSNEEEAVITILGIGTGSKQNINKLKYHKIIIMADADPDGKHIESLWLSFFLTYAPKLIENGHIYIANPPFYQIILDKKFKLNVLNEDYFKIYKEEIALKVYRLLDNSNKELPNEVFRVFLNKIIGFTDFMNSYSVELNMDPVLLELIVRNFKSLIDGNYKQFKMFGFNVKEKLKERNYKIFEIDQEYNHYYLRIDNSFYENVYKPIFLKMQQIYLSDVRIKSVKSGNIYSGTFYELSKIIDYPLEGAKNIELRRFKGLGEMNADLLKESCMDPNTRKLTKVTIKDAETAKKYMYMLMSNTDMINKKNLLVTT